MSDKPVIDLSVPGCIGRPYVCVRASVLNPGQLHGRQLLRTSDGELWAEFIVAPGWCDAEDCLHIFPRRDLN
jgi:hypothetical protein